MNSWKRLLSYLKKDFFITRKELILFSIIYSFITILYTAGTSFFNKYMSSNPILLIPFFVVVFVYGIAMIIIQYYFQRSYSKKICIPADINKLSSVIFKTMQIYVIQFLLYIGFILLIILVLMGINFFMKIQGEVFSLFVPILTFSVLMFGVIWFFRLLFVNYILFYDRINMKTKVILQESKYLVKQNLGVIITMLVVCIAVLVPQLIDTFKKNGHQSINYFSSAVYLIIGILNSYFFVIITGNVIIEHKYLFLLKPKKES